MKNIFCYVFLISLSFHSIFGQNKKESPDSAKIYKNIEKFSSKHKVSKLFYDLIFRSTTRTTAKKKSKSPRINYYEGKIIRNIDITTLDPFGHSVYDTNVNPHNFIQKGGNYLHVKSRIFTIRNLLLIRPNEIYDTLLVNESERLIRRQSYVIDVFLYTKPVMGSKDSVDIFIRVQDKWSINAKGQASSTIKLDVLDKNFLGLGHQFENSFAHNFSTDHTTFETNYFIPNIKKSYIDAYFQYRITSSDDYIRRASVERIFYSPLAKWAGGINFYQQSQKDSLFRSDSILVIPNVTYSSQDYWFGKAWRIFKRQGADRTTNLIVTARYSSIHYSDKPLYRYDSVFLFSDEKFFLTGIGINTRKFIKDRYIFGYGLIEDVPVGNVYGIVTGYQIRESDITRFYGGIRFSWGTYKDKGYYSADIQLGSFLHKSHFEQGVFQGGIYYFTNLLEIGNWKIRQFIKAQIVLGINRFPTDYLTLNNDFGIKGFNSSNVQGLHKVLISMQTQAYTSWSFIGFRFGPFVTFSAGLLGDESHFFGRSRLYSQFGIGILIKNEYLVINNFQISIAFYPVIPGKGENVIKLNPYQTTDFGFRDFSIGRPGVIPYQ